MMKPRPITVAVYIVGGKELITNIQTAEQMRRSALSLKIKNQKSVETQKETQKCTDWEDQFLSEDDDLNDAVWELLPMALDADNL